MNYKLFILIFAIVFISACSQSPDYEIIGNSVVYDDSNVYFNVTPHTLTQSGSPILTFQSKVFSGDIDLLFGFNTTTVQPTGSRVYNPHNEERSYTCPVSYSYNYTLNPNYFTCYYTKNNNGTLTNVTVFEHSFTTGNIPLRTIYWNELVEWTSWTPWTVYNYEFMGMNKWYVAKDIAIVNDTTYKLQYDLNIRQYFDRTNNGKYFIAMKPSSESIEQAIANGHFYYLDPWWDSPYLTNNLVSYYNFEDTSTKLIDVATEDGNGTITNITQNDVVTGIIGNAILFNYSGANFNLSNLTRYNLRNGTFNFWINSTLRNGALMSKDKIGDNDNDLSVSFSTNQVYSEFINTSIVDATSIILKSNVPEINKWTMVSYVFGGENTELYINGTLINQSASTSTLLYNNNSLIIGNNYGASAMFNGSIDEFSIWNTTLSASQISDLYNGGLGTNLSVGAFTIYDIDIDLNLSPTVVTKLTQISCNGTANNTFDGSNLNLTITSYLNGVLNGTESFNDQTSPYTFTSSNTLFPLNYTIGDVWNCTVFSVDANDTSINGTTSSVVTVQNSAPSFTHGDINITMNYKDTNTIQFNCTDVDRPDLNYSITNLTTDFVTPLTINLTTGLVNITGLNILDTGNHLFNVTCNDSITLASVLLNTTITNTAPSIPSTLSPPTLTFTQDSSSILTCSGSTDTEGETVYYEFWGNTTGVAATLWQNTTGTTYTLPLGSNATYYWGCRAHDTNAWSDFTSNRTITKFAVFGCANQPSPFINFSFKDEQSLANINGSIVIDSTFTVNGTDDEFSVSYTNSTEYPAYGICANQQDMTIDFDLSLTYGSVGGVVTYNPRTLTMTLANTTNATTQRALYLLDVLNGREVNFHLSNSAGTAISGVDTKVERKIGGTWTEISHDSTDASGTEQFFLDSSITHRFTFIKTGYATFVYETKPSQPDYYINLESQTSTVLYTPKLGGMNWMLRPLKGILSSNATQIFSWTVNQSISAVSNETLTGCKLLLYTGNKTTLLGNSSSNATDGQITYLSGYVQGTYNYTGKNCYVSISLTPPASIYGFAYISLANKTFEDGSQWYLVESGLWWNSLPSNPSGNTIKDILADFMQLQELSENEQSAVASNMMWFFLITVLLIGLIGFYSGIELQSPGINIWAVFITVFIASFGGWFNFHQTVSDSVWAVAFWNQWWLTFTTGLIAFGFTLNSWANRRGGM